MNRNIGSADRIIRIVVGLALILAPYATTLSVYDSGATRLVSAIIGAVLVVTALVRFCPLYRLIGVKTCKV